MLNMAPSGLTHRRRLLLALLPVLGEAFVSHTPKLNLRRAASVRPMRTQPKMGVLGLAKPLLEPNVLGVPVVPVIAGAAALYKLLDTPMRRYNREKNTVAKEYDAWTSDGILEHYWGEHIHLGWYSPEEMKAGYKKKDFIGAKYDFIDKMMEFSGLQSLKSPPAKVLDVGCGIGGTSRYLASKLGEQTEVTGITLSPKQVERATQLAKARGLGNAKFQVMDALAMTFPDNSFDMVWACESGEHMPDKKAYVEEMSRVLKPGGIMVVATWCQRDDESRGRGAAPFTARDRKRLDYLYAEWTHPHFISIASYRKLMEDTGLLEHVHTEDWNEGTIASWRHSIWVGVFDPLPVIRRPLKWYKTLRDGICLDRFHRAFKDGLMGYGMFRARKAVPPGYEGSVTA